MSESVVSEYASLDDVKLGDDVKPGSAGAAPLSWAATSLSALNSSGVMSRGSFARGPGSCEGSGASDSKSAAVTGAGDFALFLRKSRKLAEPEPLPASVAASFLLKPES